MTDDLAAKRLAGGFLVPETIHAELLSHTLSVPTMLLNEAITFTFQPMDPEQRAARDRERGAVHDAIARAHAQLLTEADGLAAEMFTLHAPRIDEYSAECRGCDYGFEGEPAAWPCTTYRTVAERFGRQFVEVPYGARMEVNQSQITPPVAR